MFTELVCKQGVVSFCSEITLLDSVDLNLAMTPGHQLMDKHLASGIINGGIGISLLAKPMAFGEDSLPSCIGWARGRSHLRLISYRLKSQDIGKVE